MQSINVIKKLVLTWMSQTYSFGDFSVCELLFLLLLVRRHYKIANQPGISTGYPHRQRNLYICLVVDVLYRHILKSRTVGLSMVGTK